jgi:K+-sensing histidine kinase KdpD
MSKGNSVLVFVTPQPECKKLIEAGKTIAEETGAQLGIMSIFPQNSCFGLDTQALEKLYEFAKEYDAQMTVYFSDDTVLTAVGHTVKYRPSIVVTGFPGENSSHFVEGFHSFLPGTAVSMVDDDGKIYRILPTSSNGKRTGSVKAKVYP